MNKGLKIVFTTGIALTVIYLCLPYYVRQAVIHLYPDINDLELFDKHVVHAPDSSRTWPKATAYNLYRMSAEDSSFLYEMHTVAFLVIQHDSIVYENYRNGWNDTLTSNLFSGTKSIVGLLVGIAHEEGYIKSLDDPVSNYLPEFKEGEKSDVTIRNLLTMSAGLSWDESYASLFSLTTQGYYGNNLRELALGLDVVDKPGKQFSYRSGESQVLAFTLEAATGKTISDYAEEKLWRSLQAGHDAYWLLDRVNRDEKAFCCFHTTARDAARFGHLMLNNGYWHERPVVPEEYMREALSPASYLLNQWGNGALDYYGFQIWLLHYRDQINPYFRGMLGQYIMAIPSRNAIFVRLGHKCSKEYIREANSDIFDHLDIVMHILDQRE